MGDVYYIARNKGQEAFQFLYERLLLLSQRHLEKATYLRENGHHLSTLLNTFNRCYCHEIQVGPSSDVTPVFLNFANRLHRLLAIDLRCHSKKPASDTFILVFDNFTVKGASGGIIIGLTLQQFHKRHYRRDIYHFEERDYGEQALLFDRESSNFYYRVERESAYLESTHYIIGIYNNDEENPNRGFPPLYGNLYKHKGMTGYWDTTGIYRLLDKNESRNFWNVEQRLVAPNRRQTSQDLSTEKIVHGYSVVGRYLLRFLLGSDDIVYLHENFRALQYTPYSSLEWDDKVRDMKSYPIMSQIVCFGGTVPARLHAVDDSFLKEAILVCINDTRINNYINCLAFALSRFLLYSSSNNNAEKTPTKPETMHPIEWQHLGTRNALLIYLTQQIQRLRTHDAATSYLVWRIHENISK